MIPNEDEFTVDLGRIALGSKFQSDGFKTDAQCRVNKCYWSAAYLVTLTYCWCDDEDRPEEHGHPGYEGSEVSREYVKVCDYHTEQMVLWWEAVEEWEAL